MSKVRNQFKLDDSRLQFKVQFCRIVAMGQDFTVVWKVQG